MCLKHFHFYSRCQFSYSLISLGFRSVLFVDLGIFFSVIILSVLEIMASAQQNQEVRQSS